MKLKALSAKETLDAFLTLAEKLWPQQPLMLEVATDVTHVALRTEGQGDQLRSQDVTKIFTKLVETRSYLMGGRAQLRPQQNGNRGFVYSCSDWIVGEFALEQPNGIDEAAVWLTAIDGIFNTTTYVDLVGAQAANSNERAALQIRERALADMQGATAKLGELLARIAQEDAEARRKLNLELERDWREKANASATEHQQRMAALEDRRIGDQAALAGERQAFAQEKAEFETGEAKFVRRRMLAKLEEVLARSESMNLSEDTQKKRTTVHGVVWAMLATAVTVAWLMGSKYFATADLHYGVPMATATVTTFATLVYYLRWNDRWFREHSEAEFAAKRYQADVVRANWLAELFAEQKQAGAELPPELLDAFTRNLFRGTTTLEETEHPFEQITSLLKRAKELKIGGGQLALTASPREKADGKGGSE